MQKLLVAILTLLFSHALLADAPKTIRFGTEASYPPFESLNKSGQLVGFDIDIANALCHELGAQCSFVNQDFDTLIPGLNDNKFDAIIAAMSTTDSRKNDVAFTDIYFTPPTNFVAPLDKNYSMGSIPGKTIGVQAGSTFETYLHNKYQTTVTVKPYNDLAAGFADLKNGKIDIILADSPAIKNWLKQNDNSKKFGIVVGPIIDTDAFGLGLGIAVRKNNPELLQNLNTALAAIRANGTYNKIKMKYFGK